MLCIMKLWREREKERGKNILYVLLIIRLKNKLLNRVVE